MNLVILQFHPTTPSDPIGTRPGLVVHPGINLLFRTGQRVHKWSHFRSVCNPLHAEQKQPLRARNYLQRGGREFTLRQPHYSVERDDDRNKATTTHAGPSQTVAECCEGMC